MRAGNGSFRSVSGTRRRWDPSALGRLYDAVEISNREGGANSEKMGVLFGVLARTPTGGPLLRRLVTQSELVSHRDGSPTRLLYPSTAARIGSRYGVEHHAFLVDFA